MHRLDARSVIVGSSAAYRGLTLELLESWEQDQDPRVKLLYAGDGFHASLFSPHLGCIFESVAHMVHTLQLPPDTGMDDDVKRQFFSRTPFNAILPFERSVFECVRAGDEYAQKVYGRNAQQSILVQLGQTFRMNHLLATVFKHVYESGDNFQFASVTVSNRGNQEHILGLDMAQVDQFLSHVGLGSLTHPVLSRKLQDIIDPQNCLVVVELTGVPDSMLINPSFNGAETLLATLIVHALKTGCAQTSTGEEFMKDHCFVNTPTNKQRRAVLQALGSKIPGTGGSWNVATVDKMQGQEARCVLSLYAYAGAQIEVQPRFVYLRNRINVALSRARDKAILIMSDQMLKMRPSILAEDPEIESGYTMFRHIHRLCHQEEKVDTAGQQAKLVKLTVAEIQEIIFIYGHQ